MKRDTDIVDQIRETGRRAPASSQRISLSGVVHPSERSVLSSHRFGPCVCLEQVLFELVAGLHSELAKRLAEVVVDGAGADEQLRGDLWVGGAVGR